jgi:hypothetical protein
MIRYALVCDKKHEFDIWFGSSTDYEKQRKRKLVTCPTCGSTNVDKAIMAPAISRSGSRHGSSSAVGNEPVPAPVPEAVAMISPQEREFRRKLRELRDHLIRNADNVGKRFPEEARKMHYGEIEHRSIYGEATPEEARQLREEGIEFHPLPILPDERN